MRYTAQERQAIAAGEFFTADELAAKPWLGRTITATTGPAAQRRDPNTAPVSAEAKAMAASEGVCAWCYEPGDARSALQEFPVSGGMTKYHPECYDARSGG